MITYKNQKFYKTLFQSTNNIQMYALFMHQDLNNLIVIVIQLILKAGFVNKSQTTRGYFNMYPYVKIWIKLSMISWNSTTEFTLRKWLRWEWYKMEVKKGSRVKLGCLSNLCSTRPDEWILFKFKWVYNCPRTTDVWRLLCKFF